MARVNSKKKGNRFELEVAKRFSEEFEVDFRRVPNSGAYTGGSNRSRVAGLRDDAKEILSGDLISPDGFGFLIECKFHANDPAFHKIIQGEDKMLDKWIEQNEGDADFVGKESLVIFKINRKGEFVAMDANSRFIILNFEEICPYMRYKDKIIVSIDNFFKIINKNMVLGVE